MYMLFSFLICVCLCVYFTSESNPLTTNSCQVKHRVLVSQFFINPT
ncbi:hypothetical protein GLYMA_15G065850v4 [Glycine max]|nr:hypothetical protein GLYMA_15G065850v4 [Glycine max]